MAFLPTAAAGEGHAAPARLSGQYRVTYHALAGAKPLGTRIWGVVPTCKHGACAIDISSRAKGQKAEGKIRFRVRGGSYVRDETDPGFSDCISSSGSVIAYKVYARLIEQHLRPTTSSPLGRALAFTGSAVYTYRASTEARSRGCKTSVQRYTFTGAAVTG
ncbi:MAG: hypothetical protein ABI317_16360 [Gaiellales bacterium]